MQYFAGPIELTTNESQEFAFVYILSFFASVAFMIWIILGTKRVIFKKKVAKLLKFNIYFSLLVFLAYAMLFGYLL